MAPTRTARLAAAAAAAAAAMLVAAPAGLAVDNVPKISDVHANPRTFCAKKSDKCSHPGTTIRFRLSTAAKVRGDIRPRFEYTGSFMEFVKRFPKGVNRVRVNDPRLKPGTWQLRLQGTNSMGSGPIALIHVHVVKHD
jgi:hypothetical protein